MPQVHKSWQFCKFPYYMCDIFCCCCYFLPSSHFISWLYDRKNHPQPGQNAGNYIPFHVFCSLIQNAKYNPPSLKFQEQKDIRLYHALMYQVLHNFHSHVVYGENMFALCMFCVIQMPGHIKYPLMLSIPKIGKGCTSKRASRGICGEVKRSNWWLPLHN